jgi:hypothetical protein
LNLPENVGGITLRTYLAEKLGCEPMRITKKYTGASCLGKRAFHGPLSEKISKDAVSKAEAELAELEAKFKNRLELAVQEKREREANVDEMLLRTQQMMTGALYGNPLMVPAPAASNHWGYASAYDETIRAAALRARIQAEIAQREMAYRAAYTGSYHGLGTNRTPFEISPLYDDFGPSLVAGANQQRHDWVYQNNLEFDPMLLGGPLLGSPTAAASNQQYNLLPGVAPPLHSGNASSKGRKSGAYGSQVVTQSQMDDLLKLRVEPMLLQSQQPFLLSSAGPPSRPSPSSSASSTQQHEVKFQVPSIPIVPSPGLVFTSEADFLNKVTTANASTVAPAGAPPSSNNATTASVAAADAMAFLPPPLAPRGGDGGTASAPTLSVRSSRSVSDGVTDMSSSGSSSPSAASIEDEEAVSSLLGLATKCRDTKEARALIEFVTGKTGKGNKAKSSKGEGSRQNHKSTSSSSFSTSTTTSSSTSNKKRQHPETSPSVGNDKRVITSEADSNCLYAEHDSKRLCAI